ncbi:C40 family peptidase [Pseudomonas typographi]|uniref:C40 family peptidase n=1 Tax=Pseudomonas typographi TaxID=2715964 RepID=UPI00168A33AA|nr:Mov34/MPN/PAD-1 family protein [Pseudomonas typographi]MBD1590167.1 phage tail protein [Pseudomonas typographi]
MKLSKDTLQAIYDDARARLPNEACGFIVRKDRVSRYTPAPNTAQNPAEDFKISAEAWAEAEDQGEIVAIVHSHPGQSARLSHADRVSMEGTGLPWLVVEVREGEPVGHLIHEPAGYQAPLIGRPFRHGVLDCYTLVRDYYQRELGIELPNYERDDGWWDKGQDLYRENFEAAGFAPCDPADLRQGDLIVMQVRSPVANHAGVYLADGKLKTEPDHHPVPGSILHHLYGRDSKRDLFGGFWRESARFYMRHKDSKPT